MKQEPTLGSFARELKSRGLLQEVEEPLSPVFEIAAVEKEYENGPALLVKNVRGSSIPVLFNIINDKEKYAIALGVDKERMQEALTEAASNPVPLEFSGKPPAWQPRQVDLNSLPIVTHFEKDAGAYVTSSMVVARNRETNTQNLSVHRLLRLDKERFAIRMVEGRHLHRAFVLSREAEEDLPVAILIGTHPAIEIAASYQAPYGFDELQLANSILKGGIKLVKLENGLAVPENAEIVLIGRISRKETAEDYMVEMLGNYDTKRMQPVVKIERMYVKRNAIFRDILPGGKEHRLLMSFSVEAKLSKQVKDAVPSTKKVVLTDGGRNWLHAVIQIKKRLEGEPKNAIMAAFAAHPSLKHVIVVDEDIDPEDPVSVEYALATRFQASRGLVIIKGAKGSSLDPSSDQQRLLTDKMGIDATASLEKGWERFEQGKIPNQDEVIRRLKKK
ncbi:MAG: UbiD family decarboxylase [Conexivisphaerales archaeon]